MIEKLRFEPYIRESLFAHLFENGGVLVVERYDTIYWVRERFLNVSCPSGLNAFVDAKKFCDLMSTLKSVEESDVKITLVLFNGARYEIDKVNPDVNMPSFTLLELKNKNSFDFGGVEKAVSKSPLQKELNTVYVDSLGAVASSSIVGGVGDSFKSNVPFAIPEGVHSLFSGEDVEWDIVESRLCARFGQVEFVAVLPRLSEFAWWSAVRDSFDGVDFANGAVLSGLRSSIARLAYFGSQVRFSDGKILIDDTHWEPVALKGDGELFDISDLLQVVTDDSVEAALVGGNLYLKTDKAKFVVCSIDDVAA